MFFTDKYDRLIFLTPIILMGIVWLVILLPGCIEKSSHKQETQYGYITYIVNWDELIANDTPRETLRFCFYPADNGPMIQTETSSDSLRIALAPGKYGLLVYNYRKNNLRLRNRTDFRNAEATFITDEEGVTLTPQSPLYGIVKEFEVKPNQDITQTIQPMLFTKQVTFQININPKDQKQISQCQGILAGVTPLLHMCDQTIKRDTTMKLPIIFEKTADGYQGKVLLLDGDYKGENTNEITNEIILNMELCNGNTITSSIPMGSSLFQTKKQNIFVDLHANVDQSPNPSLNLICKSVDVHQTVSGN